MWQMRGLALSVVGVLLIGTIVACSKGKAEPTPAGDVPLKATFGITGSPSYAKDIQPIFDEFCVKCHGSKDAENGLRLDGYDHLMAGTRFGSIVVPGSPGTSTLVMVVEHQTAQEIAMPREGHKLSPNRIANIRYWIEAGAKNN